MKKILISFIIALIFIIGYLSSVFSIFMIMGNFVQWNLTNDIAIDDMLIYVSILLLWTTVVTFYIRNMDKFE